MYYPREGFLVTLIYHIMYIDYRTTHIKYELSKYHSFPATTVILLYIDFPSYSDFMSQTNFLSIKLNIPRNSDFPLYT